MAQKKSSATVKAGKKKTRTKFYEYSAANDIKYRGPLSYQSFQLFGWICIILSVVAAIISLGSSISPDLEKDLGNLGSILSWVASCSLPWRSSSSSP